MSYEFVLRPCTIYLLSVLLSYSLRPNPSGSPLHTHTLTHTHTLLSSDKVFFCYQFSCWDCVRLSWFFSTFAASPLLVVSCSANLKTCAYVLYIECARMKWKVIITGIDWMRNHFHFSFLCTYFLFCASLIAHLYPVKNKYMIVSLIIECTEFQLHIRMCLVAHILISGVVVAFLATRWLIYYTGWRIFPAITTQHFIVWTMDSSIKHNSRPITSTTNKLLI